MGGSVAVDVGLSPRHEAESRRASERIQFRIHDGRMRDHTEVEMSNSYYTRLID